MMNDNKNKKDRGPLGDILPVIIGEALVALTVCLGFLLADLVGLYNFELRIISGALLGGAVIVGNHLWLALTVDKKLKEYMEIRGNREMNEEEADAFVQRHSAAIQRAMATSTIVRTVSIFATLILAFVTGWFNPLATAIPMFALRPILYATELIKSRSNPKPDPTRFKKYDWDEDKKSQKEDE